MIIIIIIIIIMIINECECCDVLLLSQRAYVHFASIQLLCKLD